MKIVSVMSALVLAAAFVTSPAQAIMMQDQYGSVFTLEAAPLGPNSLGQLKYQVTLTIDPSFYSGKYLSISAVDFKITPGTGNIVVAELMNSPNTTWLTSFENLNSKSICGGGGDAGFVCSQGTSVDFKADKSFALGDPFKWTWDITLATGIDLLDGLGGAHLGAKYGDASVPGQITSLTYAPVPEPSTLLLLGSGLLGLGGFAWRRNRKG